MTKAGGPTNRQEATTALEHHHRLSPYQFSTLIETIKEASKHMTQATDRLAAAVQANADAVNELIAKATAPAPENTDDAVNAAAQAIEDETARVQAALNPA